MLFSDNQDTFQVWQKSSVRRARPMHKGRFRTAVLCWWPRAVSCAGLWVTTSLRIYSLPRWEESRQAG